MKTKRKPNQADRSWKAVRRGDVYCAPACGGGCTHAAYMQAQLGGERLARRLGPGFKPEVWENLGWHYCAVSKGNHSLGVDQGSLAVKVAMGNHSTNVQLGNVSLKAEAGAISNQAMQSIELTCGGSSIKLDPTGITISGMMIKIQGQVQTQIQGLMTQISGDAMLALKGAITMIN